MSAESFSPPPEALTARPSWRIQTSKSPDWLSKLPKELRKPQSEPPPQPQPIIPPEQPGPPVPPETPVVYEPALGEKAFEEIRSLVGIYPDSTVEGLLDQLKVKGWQDTQETRRYIKEGIDVAEAKTPKTLEFEEDSKTEVRYVTREPKAGSQETIFLPAEMREKLGVAPGETIRVRIGGRVQEVRVDRQRIRDDGTIEGADSSKLRFSTDLFEKLAIPQAYGVVPEVNRDQKELVLHEAPQLEEIVKNREPRVMSAETVDKTPDAFFLSSEDQLRLGLKPGEKLTIRFGTYNKEVTVSDQQRGTEGRGWKVSENIVKEIGLPDGIPMRSVFDKQSRVFSFGPSVMVYGKPRYDQETGTFTTGVDFAKPFAEKVSAVGGVFCLVNPDRQDPQLIAKGRVDAWVYIPETGKYAHRFIPIPDVLYNKSASGSFALGDSSPEVAAQAQKYFEARRGLDRQVRFDLMPASPSRIAYDKLWMHNILKENGLGKHHLESESLNNATPAQVDAFFLSHPDAVIKPQWGVAGRGVLGISAVIETTGDQKTVKEYRLSGKLLGSSEEAVADRVFKTSEELIEALKELPQIQAEGTIYKDGQWVPAQNPGEEGLKKVFLQERLPFMEYHYNDPANGNPLLGHLEPRVVMTRGIDGRVSVASIVMRVQNTATQVPHDLHPTQVFEGLYGGDKVKASEAMRKLGQISVAVMQALEGNPSAKGEKFGEFTVDFGIREDGEPIILEANPRAATHEPFKDSYFDRPGVYSIADGRENVLAGVAANAVYRSGMQ